MGFAGKEMASGPAGCATVSRGGKSGSSVSVLDPLESRQGKCSAGLRSLSALAQNGLHFVHSVRRWVDHKFGQVGRKLCSVSLFGSHRRATQQFGHL